MSTAALQPAGEPMAPSESDVGSGSDSSGGATGGSTGNVTLDVTRSHLETNVQ